MLLNWPGSVVTAGRTGCLYFPDTAQKTEPHMEERKITFRLSTGTWWGLFGMVMLVFVALPYLGVVMNTLGLLFMTALLSMLIAPLATTLERRHVPRAVTVLLVYALLFIGLTLIVLLLVPIILRNVRTLAENGDSIVASILANLEQIPVLQRIIETEIEGRGALIDNLGNMLSSGAYTLLGTLASAGGLLFSLFIILVLVFFLVATPQLSRTLLEIWVPKRYHARIETLVRRSSWGLSRWLGAQLCISAYWVIAYSTMLTLLDIPYAITIGVISGILEFIPYLGGLIGSILMVLSALTVDPWLAVWAVFWGIPVGIVGVNFVVPFFFSRAINVHPGAILLALYVGGQVGGLMTALLTVPVVVLLTVVVRELRPAARDVARQRRRQQQQLEQELAHPAGD